MKALPTNFSTPSRSGPPCSGTRSSGSRSVASRRASAERRAALRGYSLPFVMGISAMLAFSSFAMVAAVSSASKTSGDMLRRRKAFYACDGLSRVVTKLSQAYMATTAEPTSAGLQSYVVAQGGGPTLTGIAPTGFDVTGFTVETVGDSQASVPLPSGPFRGMNARQDTIELKLEARHSDMNYVCRTEQTVTLGKVALFQFYVFSDTDFDGHPGPQMDLNGRAHVNGDACPAGRMRISRITASGALRHSHNSNCAYQPSNANVTEIQRTDGSFSAFNTSNDHDSAGWEEDAIAEWGGNALDVDHDVPELKPPTIGVPLAQRGANSTDAVTEQGGVQTANEPNTGSLRFLIDPVVVGDPADIRDQKLAWQADIRIIDGVWYKNDGTFPGEPIWSDHPGSFTRLNATMGTGIPLQGQQVGQRTVADAQGWAQIPRRYSYYGQEVTAAAASDRARLVSFRRNYNNVNSVPAVISYGSLNRLGSTPFPAVYPTVDATRAIWEPGGWVGNELCAKTYDASGAITAGDILQLNALDLLGSLTAAIGWNTGGFAGVSSAVHSCPTGVDFNGKILLNATRQGFRENHRGGPYAPEGMPDTGFRSQVLPANFDLMAFQAAMLDTGPGELGAHFNGGTDFNGIVWISYTWPGSYRGMNGSNMADVRAMDAQGTNDGQYGVAHLLSSATDFAGNAARTPGEFLAAGSQPIPPTRVTGAFGGADLQNNQMASQRELPFPLCSDDANVIGTPFVGNIVGPNGTDGEFVVQDCDPYIANGGARVTAVRVINGRDLDPENFPRGLTISTNLPIFVVGDMNTISVPFDGAVLPQPAGSRTWIPLLLAGDVMYHASNAWQDATSPWSIRSRYYQRQATETTYNISELIGWVPSAGGTGGTRFHNLQGFQEQWSGVNHNINGSVAIGWKAVYFRNNRTSGGRFAYSPPRRVWSFDTNYRLFSNQPPGTPTFDVAATKKFSRDGVED